MRRQDRRLANPRRLETLAVSDDELNLDETLEIDVQIDPDIDPNADFEATAEVGGGMAAAASAVGMESGDAEYAPVWKRIVAMILDGIIISIIFGGLSFVLGIGAALTGMSGMAGGGDPTAAMAAMESMGGKTFWLMLLMTVLFYLYGIVLPATPLRGTLGKHFMGIGIVDTNFDRIRIGRSLWRWIIRALTIVFIIPALIAFFNKQRRAVHDFAAGTVIVRKDSCPDTKALGGSIVGKVLNGAVALLLAGAVAYPVFGMLTNQKIPGMEMAMMGATGGAGGLGSMMNEGMSNGQRKVAGKMASPKKAMNKAKAKMKDAKRKVGSGPKVSANLRGLNKLAILFEDRAVELQEFPVSLVDLGLNSDQLTNYGVETVKFNSKGEMMFDVDSMDGMVNVSMNPYLDDENYVAWKCGGDVRKRDLPAVCD